MLGAELLCHRWGPLRLPLGGGPQDQLVMDESDALDPDLVPLEDGAGPPSPYWQCHRRVPSTSPIDAGTALAALALALAV